MSSRRFALRASALLLVVVVPVPRALAQRAAPPATALPLRQSSLDASATKDTLTLQDVSQLDRWIGAGARDARWSPDGAWLSFRWPQRPTTADNPDDDPWWRVDRAGRGAEIVPDSQVWRIPEATVSWSRDGSLAAWTWRGRVVVWDAQQSGGDGTRVVAVGAQPARHVRVATDARAVDYMLGEDLYRWDADRGTVRRLAMTVHRPADARTEAGRWLATQQVQLFDLMRKQADSARAVGERARRLDPDAPQVIPVEPNAIVEEVQRSPDGRFFTVRTVTPDRTRPPTLYMDYVTASGYAESKTSRAKVGEPRDNIRLGIVPRDARRPADSVRVQWVALPEARGRQVNVHGPWWSVEGDRAVIEVVTLDDHDLWIARLDPATGATSVIDHQHDDAWIGGPPVQSNYTQPGLVEWLPGGRLVFASERTGWSHLYLAEPDGTVRPLTSGAWEVRAATLTRQVDLAARRLTRAPIRRPSLHHASRRRDARAPDDRGRAARRRPLSRRPAPRAALLAQRPAPRSLAARPNADRPIHARDGERERQLLEAPLAAPRDRHHPTPRRRGGLGRTLSPRAAQSQAPRRGVRARRRLSPVCAPRLVRLWLLACFALRDDQLARAERLHRPRLRLPRERRLRARLPHRHPSLDGREGCRRRRGRRPMARAHAGGRLGAHRDLRRLVRWLHDAHVALPLPGDLRRRYLGRGRHRLGALLG
ncbi:MAG: DPP IV N-terminal domain-containing protein [Gemmatimonadetes bacterium]|nr:DPP IV N-terminal domain-containing protein [Gemmatimonadota bacterium]